MKVNGKPSEGFSFDVGMTRLCHVFVANNIPVCIDGVVREMKA